MDAEKETAEKLTERQEDYIELESTCCLCGTELIFEHELDDTAIKVQEKAQCPCCKIQLKDKEFIIH